MRAVTCIQCTDQNTGKTGSFLHNSESPIKKGNLRAVTPVFKSLIDLYSYLRKNGWKSIKSNHPTGEYEK